MSRTQYRELCRYVVAHRLKIDPGQVRSRRLSGLRRPGLVPCRYAVDLWWETENSICRYVHIGGTYWRSRVLVGEREILILQQIKEKVGGHKALAFTNTGFSPAAVRAADEAGIGLLVVRPKKMGTASSQVSKRPGKRGAGARPHFSIDKRPGGGPAKKVPYTFRIVRSGMPPVLTKDEANRHIDLPDLKAWVERARAAGRLENAGYRFNLAASIPALAPLLGSRRDWLEGLKRTWRKRRTRNRDCK
jgi:hypothetical protein